MFGLGAGELVLILIIVLIVFGVGKLPELGTGLGEGIKNFRKAYNDAKAIDVTPPTNNAPAPTSTPGSETNNDKN